MALLVSALTGEGCCEQLERVELESSGIDVLEDGGDASAAGLSFELDRRDLVVPDLTDELPEPTSVTVG